MLRCESDRDGGQLTLLIIGLVAIAATLVVVGIDASKMFLARRALSSVADAAALAAAQAADKNAIYAGTGGGCGNLLPIDPARAEDVAAAAVADDQADLRHSFSVLDVPETRVDNATVSVHLSGDVSLPFARVVALLLPGHADGHVHIDVTSHARSALTAPGGC